MELMKEIESELVKNICDDDDIDIVLDNYRKFNLSLYSKKSFKNMLDVCKFKKAGTVKDYIKEATYDDRIYYSSTLSYMSKMDKIEQVRISNSLNAVLIYTKYANRYDCMFLVNADDISKFTKKLKILVKKETSDNTPFKGVNFKCGKGEYIELAEPIMNNNNRRYSYDDDQKDQIVEIHKKKLHDENLIYTDDSILSDVRKDISLFFKESTKTMYKNMNIPHKRGIILHGDPGNGKSALIRETIRQTPNIAKIVFNPGMGRFTTILSLLVNALDGEPAIIILEDMDSIINQGNRAEFLNILDGITMISGVFFIGTTNYLERIDPAFVNRSGRFDRVYKIGNPTESIRREFFRSCNIGSLLGDCTLYKTKPGKAGTRRLVLTAEGSVLMHTTVSKYNRIIELFVKYSDGMSMAALKEFITSTSYTLAEHKELSIEEAVVKTNELLSSSKSEHMNANMAFENSPERRFSKMMNFMGSSTNF